MSNALSDRLQRPAPAPEQTGRHFHTWLSRQMVAVGLFGVLLMPLGLYFLDDDDHFGFDRGRLVVDNVGRESLRVILTVGLGTALVGWVLWTIAAALNARGRSRWSISPLSVPLTYIGVIGLAVAASAFTEQFTNEYTTASIIVVASVAVISHLGVLAAFRRAAVAIGAPDAPWTQVMVIPCAIGLVAGLGAFFTKALASQASYIAFSALTFALALLMVASWVRAMASFDRSCVGRQMTHENMDIPFWHHG